MLTKWVNDAGDKLNLKLSVLGLKGAPFLHFIITILVYIMMISFFHDVFLLISISFHIWINLLMILIILWLIFLFDGWCVKSWTVFIYLIKSKNDCGSLYVNMTQLIAVKDINLQVQYVRFFFLFISLYLQCRSLVASPSYKL
jgi:hypothetical protein